MVDCQEEQAKSSSHKNEKIKSYTLSFKLLIVKHAKKVINWGSRAEIRG